ncbi:NmrA family NAD(P)-binding protein [Halomicroarcula sp. GCM10025709]|uniref:NmrA family NAD(P)-binding protein n=1 Tax=Haloarcula TaxID=2237 RepID=UPI0024C25C83|nr:NmrA family NAD(P)-binding protein [Halomicroarcula sp. YJ-61-S]
MTRVLVTAATGTVGRHVVAELAGTDVTVRAATRDPAAASERLDADEFVEFDFLRPETWGQALDGVDRLFLVRVPGVGVDETTAFADAAARVGVAYVVYLSALGAEKNPVIPHHRIERHLRTTGMGATFLRASFFMQNLNEVHGEDVRRRDELFVPAGDGATSFVDARDVGAAAAAVLADPAGAAGSYDLTGPEATDYAAVAAVFTDVLDRPIRYADPSIPTFVARWRARDEPLGFVLLLVGIYTTARLGLAGRVTDDLGALLGREPRTLREYVVDYAAEFRPAAADDRTTTAA